MLFMRYAGLIKHIELDDRQDRIIAFVLMIVAYIFTLYMFRKLGLPNNLLKILIGGLFALLVAALISSRWKISCHSIGVGGLTGFLYSSVIGGLIPMSGFLLCALLISGAIMSARLTLDAHSPQQVYAGYLTGLVTLLII